VCKFDAESVCELLNSHDQKHTLNNPAEIKMQITLEEDVEPNPHPEPKERTMPVAHLAEGLGLIETGIKGFEHTDWNRRPAATTGYGIVGHLLVMGRF
jgi:hypothetical protein